ncbi:MAG: hypothetical protein HY720_20550 [Planctomycetes bacterium]|nr:hypothetical protein [Planctomycetota bacterium]
MTTACNRSRGSILIVALGILMLLSILAISFSQLMRIERTVSVQYQAKVQARMLAVAGVEQAMASLQREVARGDLSEIGENAWPNPALVGFDDGGTVSFGDETRQVDGVSYSTRLPLSLEDQDLHPEGLQVQVRVLDSAQLVNLSEFPRHEEGVVRILNNVGDLLRAGFSDTVWVRDPTNDARLVREDREFRFSTIDNQLGSRLLAMSTAADSYKSWQDVRQALRTAYGDIDPDLRLLSRIVTFHGMTDPATVSPALGAPVGSAMLRTSQLDHKRAPVNLNRADRLLLAAVFMGIRAEYRYFDQANASASGTWKLDGVAEIDKTTALRLADEIIAYREGRASGDYRQATHEVTNPYDDWDEFESFLYGLAASNKVSKFGGKEADLVLANASPNPRLGKFNPDVYRRYRPASPNFDSIPVNDPKTGQPWRWSANRVWVDKSDLRRYTTEFCLQSPGVYEIDSIGRVVMANLDTKASHRIRTVVRLGQELRFRTQEQLKGFALPGQSEDVALGPESVDLAAPSGQNVSNVDGSVQIRDGYFTDGQTFALSQEGNFKTRTNPTENTREVYVYPDGQPNRVTMTPNQSQQGSIFNGGNRHWDGYYSGYTPNDRYIKFDSKTITPKNSVGFWVKLDEEAQQGAGGFLFSTNVVVNKVDTCVQRLVYMYKGTIRITSTWCSIRASVPQSVAKNEVRLTYTGETREDAFQRLYREGYEWLKSQKPGQDEAYYRSFGEHFARQVLTAFAQGDTKVVKTYIYDAERVEGLGHLGCVTKVTQLDGEIEAVFKPGTWKVENVTKSTEAYLAEVNETAKFNYQFESSMGADFNSQADQLFKEAQQLTNEANTLEDQANKKEDEASKLEQEADKLNDKAAELRAEADGLDAQADQLEKDGKKKEADDLRKKADDLRKEADKLEAEAAKKYDQAAKKRAEAQKINQDAVKKLSDAAGKIKQASEYLSEDAQALKLDYERITKKGLENPNRYSRVEVWTRKPADWKPGEWRHVHISFDDELNTGYNGVVVRLDNETPTFERKDVWGPLDVWGSRQVQLKDEFYPGPFTLRRASAESGKDDNISGTEPRVSFPATLADYRVYNQARNNPPLAVRFDPDDAAYTMEFDLTKLQDWGNLAVPKGWTLRGTLELRSQRPMLRRTDGKKADPMVDIAATVNGQALGARGALPAPLLARDAAGAYQPIRTRISFNARSLAGPYDASDVREGTYQMHTPILEEIVFRFLVPPVTLIWEETDKAEGQ